MKILNGAYEYTSEITANEIEKIAESFKNGDSMDEWGNVTLTHGNQGIELNLAFENYTWQTAFYKMENNGEYFETDYDSFYHFTLDLYEGTCEESLMQEAIKAFHELWNIETLSWDDIYELAMNTGFGDEELTRKDEARYQMCCWASEHLGYDPEEQYERGEIDSVEEELDWLDSIYKFVFDKSGNIISYAEKECA